MAKVFKTAFDEVVSQHISTTTKELNFDNYTECGTYQIYEDMGKGLSCTHYLIVDKSASGACTTQTKTCKGKVEYRCYNNDTGKWSAWETKGGGGTDLTDKQIENINSIPDIKADIGDIDTALDNIIAIQNELIGGDSE